MDWVDAGRRDRWRERSRGVAMDHARARPALSRESRLT